MYDYWVAIIIGIVEGLTEFLPVSSTGHMILTQKLLGISESDAMLNTFKIVIQLGAILAVLIIYWKRVLSLFGLVKLPKRGGGGASGTQGPQGTSKLSLIHILIGIVPVMLLAFLLDDFIEQHLFAPSTVIIGLVIGGILMIAAEKQKDKPTAEDVDHITYRQALYIGLWQILSLWPGFSRSGATIAGGMLSGVNRGASADFTFIMAIPIMFAATGYSLLKSYKSFSSDDITFFIIGFVISFIVALLAVVSFIKFVQKMKLTYFAYYRFALAAAFALYLWLS
ncbi:undecaprenyl-diphosphate phosphatase [Paenibacillus eucommiae]|uniref:Undecaprenyl-diphosphatase n=1 Tax=Paenibacillus eucommiae TaxID=1355755 RepID=A0ABS4JAX9_9BACL|nr:undecaprenyl-diphosphate phosphatase [Paenibacillus eucommiae]MBP1995894.1 undecaprenyl-diphosphatase [Paenibacillus eucommiae]